jgi:hypothetical protein
VVASPRPFGAVVRVAARSIAALTSALHDLVRAAAVDVLGDDPFARRW